MVTAVEASAPRLIAPRAPPPAPRIGGARTTAGRRGGGRTGAAAEAGAARWNRRRRLVPDVLRENPAHVAVVPSQFRGVATLHDLVDDARVELVAPQRQHSMACEKRRPVHWSHPRGRMRMLY